MVIKMGVTKTDFMRGIQCPKMLWLDRHHPELKVIPPETQHRLDRGNDFGDGAMGLFGPFTEVREYYPGSKRPDKERMAAKTAELLAAQIPVICEAAFMDDKGNYCATDILRKSETGYEMYEVKNSTEVKEQFIKDAGFQAFIIRNRCHLSLQKVFIVYNSGISESPYEIEDVTKDAFLCANWVADNIDYLGNIKEQPTEVQCYMGMQCSLPYECWYADYCRGQQKSCLTEEK